MSTPSSRSEFKEYCLRQLGAPVLEINLADEQCEDIIDDAIQYFQERHFDGAARMFLKYQITQGDIDRGQASAKPGSDKGSAGIVTTTATAPASSGISTVAVDFDWSENSNYLQDSFLKPYTTALMKKQWGQNLLKFQGVKLPGGVELNGRQIYDDGEKDLDRIREMMSSTYELPPLDMIG